MKRKISGNIDVDEPEILRFALDDTITGVAPLLFFYSTYNTNPLRYSPSGW